MYEIAEEKYRQRKADGGETMINCYKLKLGKEFY